LEYKISIGRVRQDTIRYFKENKISWWSDGGNEISGHLLSSQIALQIALHGPINADGRDI